MEFNIIPAIAFVIITTITPGPNNIMSTSMGVMYGYRRALPFLIGIATGYLILLLTCSSLSLFLTKYLPSFTPYIRIIGAIYIFWLAYTIFRNTSFITNGNESKPLKFQNGFLLQFVNPKAIFCGLTVFTTFLSPILDNYLEIILYSILFSCICFSAISTWALSGNLVRGYLNTPIKIKILGVILSLALVCTAIDILDIFR